MTIAIAMNSQSAARIIPALEALGSGDLMAGVLALMANAAGQYARGIQSGIVRPQLKGASQQDRASLMQSIQVAEEAAINDVLGDGAVVVEVT
jgi:hypothetical protein